MPELQMGAVEARFADIIWAAEPVTGAELVKRAAAAFGWKRTTTYTVLKRLCDKGLFQNNGGTVTSLMSREDYYARRSHQYVEETFAGSLPAFFAAFTRGKPLSAQDREELRKMIDAADG
ncbi:MAG: BlaI/MecI/CopY family transcriptional regulator [Clostridia bacterium]|nr:BlaI/MecI/CopY family transcriptional regulator [Clostridia bacterium]